MVVILLGNGFEEIEALAPCDVLRRAGVETVLAGIGGDIIASGRGIAVKADCNVEEIDINGAEQLVIPGGMGGVESILASDTAMGMIKTAAEAGIPIAAICAGPTILSKLGLLKNKRAVCHPSCQAQLDCAAYLGDESVVVDGNIITARAAASSFDFGLAILASLRGAQAAQQVAEGICYAR